jgi:RNA polymerase sigma factor (sigma-70 family)
MPTDNQLEPILRACRRGNLGAQKLLYERLKSRLFQVCLRYSRDRPEAQDMLQDAFLTIFRDLHQFSGQGAFEGWAVRVTVRSALQHLRRRNPLRFADDYQQLPSESLQVMPDTELKHAAILDLVQMLPTGYRTVFNLRCIEAWPYEEIAAELNITESSVRSQYTRACHQLRHLFEKHLNTV